MFIIVTQGSASTKARFRILQKAHVDSPRTKVLGLENCLIFEKLKYTGTPESQIFFIFHQEVSFQEGTMFSGRKKSWFLE